MATDTFQPSAEVSTPKTSIIGNELSITGNVTSNGEIQLDGQVQGDIQCASLVLGENSQLEGSAVAEEVLVGGRLIGSVRAVRVRLQASSHVEGDLLCQTLAIEQGAYFDGKSRRSDDPLSTQYGLVKRAADELNSMVHQPRQPNEKLAIAIVPSFPEPG
jgi:cytoskeletal protein CcmA (bactofilin family)